MPSPFPGMDPFIECQEWPDFHANFIVRIQESLNPQLLPKYVAKVERRIYLEHFPEEEIQFIRPDVAVTVRDLHENGGSTAVSLAEPVVIPLPLPEEQKEAYLYIRENKTMEVVTIIELLSPGNKRTGSSGRTEYIRKREEILLSRTNLVELDLLRGGAPLPTLRPLPVGDYFVLVCRAERRGNAEVYPCSLRTPLPNIPIPLAHTDEDAHLNLQEVFETSYLHAGCTYSLDYEAELKPPFSPEEKEWAAELLQKSAE